MNVTLQRGDREPEPEPEAMNLNTHTGFTAADDVHRRADVLPSETSPRGNFGL